MLLVALTLLASTTAVVVEVASNAKPVPYDEASHDWPHTPDVWEIVNCTIPYGGEAEGGRGGLFQIRTDYSLQDATWADCVQTRILKNEVYVPTVWDSKTSQCLVTTYKECGHDCIARETVLDCESMAWDTCERTCQVRGTGGPCISPCQWHNKDQVCYAGGMVVIPNDWQDHTRFCIGHKVDAKDFI